MKWGLHQWTSVSTKLTVVKRPIDYTFHFLHVSLPINFCVFDKQNNNATQ